MPDGRVSGFFHGGVTVSDLDRSLAFYRDALGLAIQVERLATDDYLRQIHGLPFTAVRMAFLAVPGSPTMVELLQYRGLPSTPARTQPSDPGTGHLCLYVDDLDALDARLRAAGYHARSPAPVTVTAGPNIGSRVVYFEDPDGYPVELLERPRR
ncbi:MAG: hypothetical protein A2X23_09140 [Chloroflexi bacterium GWC2_73_18]|nr:MAG: hypothetical protein A2X23_09140 [Chloroflexi bacterium GWC2_73_18]